jgi:hypothetical protein
MQPPNLGPCPSMSRAAALDNLRFVGSSEVYFSIDRGYVHSIEQFEFVPSIFELARFAYHEIGWLLSW